MDSPFGRLLGFAVQRLFPESLVWLLARRFIAGKMRVDAVEAVRKLNCAGFEASINYIGEECADPTDIFKAVEEYALLIAAMSTSGIKGDVSFKLSHFGLLGLGSEPHRTDTGLAAVYAVVSTAAAFKVGVWIDAERLESRSETWRIASMLSAVHPSVGVRIQAYAPDAVPFLRERIQEGWRGAVCVCKGAYREPDYSLLSRENLANQFLDLCELLVSSRIFLQVATHDEFLIKETLGFDGLREYGMLRGVRPILAEMLKNNGEKVRIYTPYGIGVKNYVARRIIEHPSYVFLPFSSR